ncbi:TetR/AcrR family transcriptional regulator [Dictyobacter formicarum]|uniref:TetR family transcriptional regulator n=1 Tax=Dictyobacter formicarum TaxID=2778368 RepID=A0ABQ3VKI0_9CHLR|nr:TetR/AcrR family transcriptional regulator [Dictyobacter formicarum]GHO86295.1 TetR family transcriptional regulator [Dictyobacter formicarum]
MDQEKLSEESRSKRDAILAAARTLFVKKGYEETTIADIAREANIAVGTVYLYFRSKRDVYTGVAVNIEDMIAASFLDPQLLSLPFTQIPRALVDGIFRVSREHMNLISFLQTDMQSSEEMLQHKDSNERITAILADIFQRAIERGELAPFHTEMYSQLLCLLGDNVMYQCFAVENGEREALYHDYFVEMVERLFFGPSLREGQDRSSADS